MLSSVSIDLVYLFYLIQTYLQPIKRKKEGEEKRMTQEEMLLEAAQTGEELSVKCYSYVNFYYICSDKPCVEELIFTINFRNYEFEKFRTRTGKGRRSQEKSCCA